MRFGALVETSSYLSLVTGGVTIQKKDHPSRKKPPVTTPPPRATAGNQVLQGRHLLGIDEVKFVAEHVEMLECGVQMGFAGGRLSALRRAPPPVLGMLCSRNIGVEACKTCQGMEWVHSGGQDGWALVSGSVWDAELERPF